MTSCECGRFQGIRVVNAAGHETLCWTDKRTTTSVAYCHRCNCRLNADGTVTKMVLKREVDVSVEAWLAHLGVVEISHSELAAMNEYAAWRDEQERGEQP